MKLQSCWHAADDTTLVEMLREPDQSEGLLHISALMELERDAPICVYDEKDYNLLEWSLTNDYLDVFSTLVETFVEHAQKNPDDVALLLEMMHEAQRMCTSVHDHLRWQHLQLENAIDRLIRIPRPRIEDTFRPDYG